MFQRNPPGRIGRCSKCSEPSYLRIVMPSDGHPGYDERLYECKSCGYAETLFVRIGEEVLEPVTRRSRAPSGSPAHDLVIPAKAGPLSH
jgi:hypothetical protein